MNLLCLNRCSAQFAAVGGILAVIASAVNGIAQEKPPDALYSPDRQYSVTIFHSALPGSDPYSGFFTIAVRSGERDLAKYPTQGYLIDAFWSPDGKYVAVDNRRGNSGDYLWVFSLRNGSAIKTPIDAGPKRPAEYYENQLREAVGRVTAVYHELTYDQFNKLFTTAQGWTKSGELQVKTNIRFRNLENEIAVLLETYKVEQDKLVLIDQKVQKVPK